MKKSTLIVALVAGTVSSAVFADVPSVTRIFRTPRHTRGNTNILKVQPIDDASWVWMPGNNGTDISFLKFRNEFEVKEGDGKLTIDVSADERFYLTCDGTFVARGPNRSTVERFGPRETKIPSQVR